MTAADEPQDTSIAPTRRGRVTHREEPPLRLRFNGQLSADELRMAAQATFDGPASWETE